MEVIIFDSFGNQISSGDPASIPDQQVANAAGEIVNPATNEAVSALLTDVQLRATPVPVSGTVTATTDGLTDMQLRAAPVPVSGTVTAIGPLTDTQIRATPVPVSVASLPLPPGAATEVTLADLNAKIPVSPAQDRTLPTDPSSVRLASGVGFVDVSTVDGKEYLGVNIRQDHYILVQNSTTTNLAVGGVFTGIGESTSGAAAVSVAIYADQPITVQVQQSADNVNWDISDSFFVSPNDGKYSRQFSVVSDYARVIATNTGLVATTVFRLSVQKIPVSSNLPRALTQSGSLKVAITESSEAPTYSAVAVNTTTAALATDIMTITGSATKVVKIHAVRVSGTQTNDSQVNFLLVKRSTANTGGTSLVLVPTPYDSLNPPATAVVMTYSANPILGTAVGTILAEKIPIVSPTRRDKTGVVLYENTRPVQPIILRGANEQLSINLNGVTVLGALLTLSIEWSEE